MSDRHWGAIYAAILAVSVLGSGTVGWLLYRSADASEVATKQQRAKHTADYANRARVANSGRCANVPAPGKAECIREERDAARQGYHDESDLEAQLVTATWTRHMGIAAIIGMAVGIVGLGLISITFWVTRNAAESAQKTYRAFIDVERPRLMPQHGSPIYDREAQQSKLLIQTENIGKSSAYVTGFAWEQSDNPYYPDAGFTPKPMDISVHAQATEDIKVTRTNRGIEGTTYVKGVVVYRSPFQRGHLSYFCFRVQTETIPSGGYKWKVKRHKLGKWPDDT